MYYISRMKTLNVRVSDRLAAELDAELRVRRISKSDVVRERLQNGKSGTKLPSHLDGIADLIGSVEGLPEDLSARIDPYLRETGFGRNRTR